jgi:ABC-type antimicrobial peptide transport system permease subunit
MNNEGEYLMKLNLFHIIRRSLSFNKPGFIYLALVIVILTAVITGSLMTGGSVRKSLKNTSLEKLGNTGIVISSTNRYFDPSLTERIRDKSGVQCTGVLEINGYCQNFGTGQTSLGVKIFAIDHAFVDFQGIEGIKINKGEAVINEKLADYLGLKPGDDLVLRFKPISDIPSDAPFAPEQNASGSVVLKIGSILTSDQSGNFSLGISQITPLNVFVNRDELTDSKGKVPKTNRLLIKYNSNLTVSDIKNKLQELLKPQDIGLKIRFVPRTGGLELVSDRIFIDQVLGDEIRKALPSSFPLITYLGNSFKSGNKSAPYSFISALPHELYPEIPDGNEIIINKWLAEDLNAREGDSMQVSWFSPDPLNRLVERNGIFKISKIVEIKTNWADSLLMPEFPGIAGKESCSDWDAGVSINMDLIRKKDEDYWNRYRGTPKAFINYSTGEKLWGSNFGPATAVRFLPGTQEDEILSKLTGYLSPDKCGFIVTDLREESIKAAGESVDFSTLFLSLGFFIILSSIILLILVVSTFYDSKKEQISTLFSLGFTNRWIRKFIFVESGIIGLAGTLMGAFAGLVFNVLIIKALNSVWQGAVQTNTLSSDFNPAAILTGFIISFAVILIILRIKSGSLLRNQGKSKTLRKPSPKRNLRFFFLFITLTVSLIICSFVIPENSVLFLFSGGITMFFSLILLSRHWYIRRSGTGVFSFRKKSQLSSLYYAFNSSQAVIPVIFLAAGLFAVIITGVNRMNVNDSMLKPAGGTGGYLLWGESAIPVLKNLNNPKDQKELGLDEPYLKDMSFVQALKLSGDDASCLNLNHVTSPPLLGLDPSDFIRKKAFSFASGLKSTWEENPWNYLNSNPSEFTIYGIADQTVLQYGLKIKTGDTLLLRSESGRIINLIIAAGLKSSVFQGSVIVSRENLNRFFPSVSGNQVFLVDGDPELSKSYKDVLTDRLAEYGVHFEPAGERLASFFVVTNTYLSVFSILGGLGLIMGVIGLGFILLRNFSQRKKEFGLLIATGFSLREIKKMILRDQMRILFTGVFTGLISALIATLPSILSSSGIPWKTILVMICLIILSGISALTISLRPVSSRALISSIRKE